MSATIDRIIATPTHIRYAGSNGFLVLNAKDENGKSITLTGNYDIQETSSEKAFLNHRFCFFGAPKQTPYGEQFAFNAYSIIHENTESEMFYFLTRIASGISKKNAEALMQGFGDNLVNVIENHPSALLNIKGIKKKKADNIVEAWASKKHLRELTGMLAPYGISNTSIKKIYDSFKEESVKKVMENPYILTQIKGFGFKKADEVALKLGFNPAGIPRIKAGILYCMYEKVQGAGDTFVERNLLYSFAREALECKEYPYLDLPIDDTINDLIAENKLHVEMYENTECLFLQNTFLKEQYILETFRLQKDRKASICTIEEAESYLAEFEKTHNITLSQEQREAVISAQSGDKIIAITGAAGTGKTSVSRAILGLFEKKYGRNNIVCCALSGVAAARVKKQSGYESSTIHTLLGYDIIKKGFARNEENPIPANVVLLDEASMVDLSIFHSLLKAIDFHKTHLILLGDSAQLHPIGCGEIFNDTLDFNLTKKIRLTKIFRQDESSALTTLASEVRIGRVPDYKGKEYKDFFFGKMEIPYYWQRVKGMSDTEKRAERDNIQEQILNYMRRCVERGKLRVEERFGTQPPKNYEELWERLSYTQIITPQKEGILGVKNLNKEAQKIFNPPDPKKPSFEAQDYTFAVGDKVIHLVNKNLTCIVNGEEDEKRVFNGQIGVITCIDNEEDEIIVEYPNEGFAAIYSIKHFMSSEITLAYAISIHKSQGSEFSVVFIPMTMNHAGMLNSKLIYTAMTRAKNQVIFMGETYAFEMGCKRKNELRRKTLIKIRQEQN